MSELLCGVVDPITGVACDQPHGHVLLQAFLPVGGWGLYDHHSQAGGVWFNDPPEQLVVGS